MPTITSASAPVSRASQPEHPRRSARAPRADGAYEKLYIGFRTLYSPSKKAGQPQPLLNLVALLYSGVPHPAHPYTPEALWCSYSPVPAGSVPFWRKIRNCSAAQRVRDRDDVAPHLLLREHGAPFFFALLGGHRREAGALEQEGRGERADDVADRVHANAQAGGRFYAFGTGQILSRDASWSDAADPTRRRVRNVSLGEPRAIHSIFEVRAG